MDSVNEKELSDKIDLWSIWRKRNRGVIPIEPVAYVYIIGIDVPVKSLAMKLRRLGFRVMIDVMGRSNSKQIKEAKRRDIPLIIYLGERERKRNRFTVRNLDGNVKCELKWCELIKTLDSIKEIYT